LDTTSSDTASDTVPGERVGNAAIAVPGAGAPGIPPPAQPLQLLPLHTPAEAARLLAVPESWLRRQVTARLVPHTRLGKHLRFSHADLVLIATAAARPAGVAGAAGVVEAARRSRGRRPRAASGW
jgi:excisionase family DNA binding protein